MSDLRLDDLISKEEQNTAERLVFRVLDVDHKDYQAAWEGFVALCYLADAARAVLDGQPVWWCEEHEWPSLMTTYCGKPWPDDCRMVERVLVDPKENA